MSQVLVWKSDTDSKLFEHKDQYLKHLKKLAQARVRQRQVARVKQHRAEFLTNMGATVTCIKELREFIAANWQWFTANGAIQNGWREQTKSTSHHRLVDIGIDVRWSDHVSNSHSCPRDGVQNWGGNNLMPDGTLAPKFYPGWQGQIRFKVDPGSTTHETVCGADYFRNTTINTGSGGGANERQYEVRLFAADFPAMTLAREQARVWAAVGGQDVVKEFA